MTSPTEAANKDLVRRGLTEMFNPGDWARMPEFFAPDIVLRPTVEGVFTGHKDVIEFFGMVLAAFPDRAVVIEDLIAEGDRVVVRWISSGTHLGEFQGFLPTGKRFEVPEASIYTVRDGLAAEIFHVVNLQLMMKQLGLIPDGPMPAPVKLVLTVNGWLRKRFPPKG